MAARTLPSQAFLCECFDYDPETGVLIWRVRPREHFVDERAWKIANTKAAGKVAGKSSNGRRIVLITGSTRMAHRVIYKIMTGKEPPAEIDHEDTDGTNNRWTNLRVATSQANKANKAGHNQHGNPKGVRPKHKRWKAEIGYNYRTIHLGTFDTPEAASDAYYAAAQRLFGEFARKG